jgi:hypothetical protein
MSFERRVDRLAKLFAEASEANRTGPDPDIAAILDELASLKASRAVGYRGGVRQEPQDLPAKILGEGYTRAELRALAIARPWEARSLRQSDRRAHTPLSGNVRVFRHVHRGGILRVKAGVRSDVAGGTIHPQKEVR